MLHLFRQFSPFTVLILIISALLLKFQALSHPVMPEALANQFVFDYILRALSFVFHDNKIMFTALAITMLLLQALYINYISVRHKLFYLNTYLPAFSYLLLTSFHPAMSTFSAPLIANWALLGCVYLMLGFNQTSQPRKQIFNAAFILSLAVIVYPPAIVFFILFLLSLALLRPLNIGEWTVGLMGILTPLYLLAGLLFLFDRFSLLATLIEWHSISIPPIIQPVYFFSAVVGVSLLILIGLVLLQTQVAKLTVYVRRAWGVLILYLVFGISVMLLSISNSATGFLFIMPSVALMITQCYVVEKRKWFSNFAFYFSVILLIFCQLALTQQST
ncbi:MAG: hypothetical protein JSS78_10880 [Bacteroidetes bacterium]|nr:hypothetical protein [Bacteroidota bacterium]